jgi:capsule polysaccharide export protein KpsE/RkpR
MADANINIGVNVNSKSISQLEAQLATLNAKIKSVAVGSAEFTKLSTQIQSVEKSLVRANTAIKGFNPEETFGRLAKVAGGVGAAFAAANLFIGENEDATKASAEAQKALVAVLGLSQVAEAALSAFQLIRTNALIKEDCRWNKTFRRSRKCSKHRRNRKQDRRGSKGSRDFWRQTKEHW